MNQEEFGSLAVFFSFPEKMPPAVVFSPNSESELIGMIEERHLLLDVKVT